MSLMLLRDEMPPAPIPRPYQNAAADAVLAELASDVVGTLLLMATGTGKTNVACEIMRRWLALHPATRVLFMAHRDELIQQAKRRIEHMLGLAVDTEKAEHYDAREHAIVVASVQTLSRAGRLTRHKPDAFSLIITDEVHHAASDSYVRVLDHFTGAKRLGLTATATRADGKKLGTEWESVAYEYGLRQAIADKFLCQIRRKAIMVEGLCLDAVATRGGDLAPGQLEEKVLEDEATVHAWARGILDAAGARKVIAFCPGVESSRRLAECLNRYAGVEGKEEIAIHLDGETEQNERRIQLARFARGEFRILTNCGLFLEGYDEPSITCVAMCRPTKSPGLYTQMLGRGTRIFPGKDDLLVLDFTSNSQRHDIVTAIDILSDGESDEVRDGAEAELAADSTLTVEQGIAKSKARAEAKEAARIAEEERRRTEATRAHIKAKAQVLSFDIDRDPDAFLGVNKFQIAARAKRFGVKPLTDKARAWLEKSKMLPENWQTEEGAALAWARVAGLGERAAKDMSTPGQGRVLGRAGLPQNVPFKVASAQIDALAKANWRPSPQERARIEAMGRGRDPGQEG